MLIVMSPAKALDFTRPEGAVAMTTPQMGEDIAELSAVAKKLRAADLKKMMDLSDNLAELKQSVYEYETTCGEECTLEHYLAHVALFTNADAGDSRDRDRRVQGERYY